MAPGTKRRPTDELEGEQRLAKRFDLLKLENGGKQNVGGRSSADSSQKQRPQPASDDDNGYMQVEDTKDKIYIYDLDKELAEVESDEDHPVFIPDIEKHVMKLPKSVLLGDDVKAMANKQMVLYRVPTSLSVSEDKDSVRRAIIETRRRAQENQPFRVPDPPTVVPPPIEKTGAQTQANGITSSVTTNGVLGEDDPDAMDIS